MSDLGTQVGKLLNRRFSSVVEKAGRPFLKEIFERMKQLTTSGQSFRNLKYDSRYSNSHRKTRERKGYQTAAVDLRMSTRRIEYDRMSPSSKTYAEIGFERGGNIFYMHQNATAKGNKYRQIFPQVWLNVPDDIRQNLFKRIAAIMNGRNV